MLLADLPYDILDSITALLDIPDQLSLRATSHQFNTLVKSRRHFWYEQYLRIRGELFVRNSGEHHGPFTVGCLTDHNGVIPAGTYTRAEMETILEICGGYFVRPYHLYGNLHTIKRFIFDMYYEDEQLPMPHCYLCRNQMHHVFVKMSEVCGAEDGVDYLVEYLREVYNKTPLWTNDDSTLRLRIINDYQAMMDRINDHMEYVALLGNELRRMNRHRLRGIKKEVDEHLWDIYGDYSWSDD